MIKFQHTLLSWIIVVALVQSSFAVSPPHDLTNVLDKANIIDAFQDNADVYLCSVKNVVENPQSNVNFRYGRVDLHVDEALRGKSRVNLVLGYGYFPPTAMFGQFPVIWPNMADVGKHQLLCVVVPNAYDPNCLQAGVAGEAASEVLVVHGPTDPQFTEIKSVCGLWAADNQHVIKDVQQAESSNQQAIRVFALEMAIMRVGELHADQAVQILSEYKSAEHDSDMQLLLRFMTGKFGRTPPNWDQFDVLLCHCFIAISRTSSRPIRDAALNDLANSISSFAYRPRRLQAGLTSDERRDLSNILDQELNGGSKVMAESVNTLRAWLNG